MTLEKEEHTPLIPWLRPFTMSLLYEEEPPPLKSTSVERHPLRSTPLGAHRTGAAIELKFAISYTRIRRSAD